MALTMLVVQNASVSLLTRLSRTQRRPGQRVYIPAVAVFSAELLKLAVSMSMLVRERRRIASAKGKKSKNVVQTMKLAVWDLALNQRQEIIKLAVPAALYAIQNTLLVSVYPTDRFVRAHHPAASKVYCTVESGRGNISDYLPSQCTP